MKKTISRLFFGQRFRKGVSLLELVIAIAISAIPISAISVLLVGGQRGWQRTYYSANRAIEIEGQAAIAEFDRMVRNCERDNCSLYFVSGSSQRTPLTTSAAVLVTGKAVEFMYEDNKSSGSSGRSNQSSAN